MANKVLRLTSKSTGKVERVVIDKVTNFYEEEEGVTKIYLVNGNYVLVTESEMLISRQINES